MAFNVGVWRKVCEMCVLWDDVCCDACCEGTHVPWDDV